MLAKRPPLSLFQVQTFGGTYSAGSVTGASVISWAPGFFRPCLMMGGLPHGGIIVPLISPLPGTATRASPAGQFVVAVGAISMLRFRISTATKQKAGNIRGGMHHAAKQVVDAVLWYHARDRLWRSRLGARDHQGRLHRSAFRTVRASRRRQPEADAVHHRLHQRQGRRARQEVRTGSVRQQVAAVGRADRAQERDRPEHALHHAVQRLQHRLRPDRRRQQAQRPQPG